MFSNDNPDYSSTCAAIATMINECDLRIRLTEQNMKLRDSYQEKLERSERNILAANAVIELIKPMIRDIQDYVAKRREDSMLSINNALRLAGEIIPNSTEGIYFKQDGEDAWLATPDDLEVDMVEGGGYRQISSTFLRSVVLQTNPDMLQTMFLDEIFSLVSPENSSTLSMYLNVICQDMQVISIEQKPQIYSNIDGVRYTFKKSEDFATVEFSKLERTENNT